VTRLSRLKPIAGLLGKLMHLLVKPGARQLALRSLTAVTHHGSIQVRTEIARHTPILLRLIQSNPTDYVIAELVVTILAHSVGAIINSDQPPRTEAMKAMAIPDLIRIVTEVLHKAPPSRYLMDDAIKLLGSVTRRCPAESKACPSMLNFLVANLRVNDLILRCSALAGLINLHYLESEFDRSVYDPKKMMSEVQRGFPKHLKDVMMDYGLKRCSVFMTLKAIKDYGIAMTKCANDKNLYNLGLALAELITRTEHSTCIGAWETDDSPSGQPESMDLGLPFIQWDDALPHCAAAIRQKGIPAEQDLADILDLKYFVVKERIQEAVTLAKKCIDRSPTIAYFYYPITLYADPIEGLRAAKKGLMCKRITPFVRFQLMQRAVDHAGTMILNRLPTSVDWEERKWDEGIAFLTSALEDAKIYVKEAPPDSRHLKGVLYWYCLLTLTMKGPEIREDMRELKVKLAYFNLGGPVIMVVPQDSIQKLEIVDEIGTILGVPPPKTELRLTHKLVMKLYPAAIKEWGTVIDNFNDISSSPPIATASKTEDDLAAWLGNIDQKQDGEGKLHKFHSHLNSSGGNDVELYRCSWCGHPSAVLRACSACERAR
jgi:hypothetical protein